MSRETGAAGLDEIRTLLAELALDDPAFDERRERLIEEAAALRYAALRVERPELPTIDLVFGPSGSGKSTLFNALAGGEHALTSSVERPTTRGALVGAHRRTIERALELDVFPTFEITRSDAEAGRHRGEEGRIAFVDVDAALGEDALLVDSPDYDTRVDANRRIAERLLRWADRVVFVVAMERYADRSAAEHLAEIARLGVPVLWVMNKVDARDTTALEAAFRERLDELGAPARGEIVLVPRVARGGLARADAVDRVRAFLAAPPDDARWRRRFSVFAEDLRRTVCAPIAEHGRRTARLLEALTRSARAGARYAPDPQLAGLQHFEEEARFWLRHAPRKLLRDAVEVFRQPRRFFQGRTPPREADPEAIAATLTDQAWAVVEHVQMVARETLKTDPLGRAALASPTLAEAEMDRDRVRAAFAPLIDHLTAFAASTVARFRTEWEGRERSVVAGARRWAVHAVLRIVFVCVHATVVPAVLHELLRFLGYGSFSSEVEAEIARSRERFREHLDRTIAEQMASYGRLVASLGPDVRHGERLERAIDAAEETLG